MGLFKKTKPEAATSTPADLGTLLLQGQDMIEQTARAHMSWGLGTADRWDLDQQTGLITWTFPDKTATAPAQLLGSHNPTAGSWMWAWANSSILPEMSRDARKVRDWAQAHGHPQLALPKVPADDENAATLAALAFRITEATGLYRGTGHASIPFITFGAVTLTTSDGEVSSFTLGVS